MSNIDSVPFAPSCMHNACESGDKPCPYGDLCYIDEREYDDAINRRIGVIFLVMLASLVCSIAWWVFA